MLKRKIYKQLLDWKNNHVNKALMVKGARQVGKTYIIREFGKKEYKSYIEINFIKQTDLKNIFGGCLAAEEIFKRMTAYIPGIKLIPNDTLIFFDEIQNCGQARTAIKFLAEDGRFDVISSGSLLGLTYAENGDTDAEEPESVPTGYEDSIQLYSLDFEEFLWAEGYSDEAIMGLKEYFDRLQSVPDSINQKYEQLFREYIVVGGMPEVVADYVQNHDFNRVDALQKMIISNYKFDIAKHAKGAEKIKVQNCYDSIPKQLAKEYKKFQYSVVEKGQTKKKFGGSVQWLKDSNLVHVCYNIHEPYIPLLANAKDEQFKMYINDTGLLCSIYGFETKKSILDNTIKGSAKGGIYENIISESLVKKNYHLFYYKPDDNSELEFLIEKGGEVVPVEVKSSNNSSASLNRFILDFKPTLAYKMISGNIGYDAIKVTLPHYMVIFL